MCAFAGYKLLVCVCVCVKEPVPPLPFLALRKCIRVRVCKHHVCVFKGCTC